MIDLQAIQRLEARFGAGKPHDSERLGDGNSVVGRGPDGPLTDASPFANGRPVGVPWQDTEPLDFTDQELWDEVGEELPVMWDISAAAATDAQQGPTVPEGPDTFTIISRPEQGLVSAPADAPDGAVPLDSLQLPSDMEILPPLVIKLTPPPQDQAGAPSQGLGAPPGDGWQELLWHQSWDSYEPPEGERGAPPQAPPPPEWRARERPVVAAAAQPAAEDARASTTAVQEDGPSPTQQQPPALLEAADSGLAQGPRAVMGALPVPGQVTPLTQSAAKQLKLALPPSEEADGEQVGYWTQRLQQLGALDEVGAPVVTIDPKTGRARPLAVPMVVNAVLAGASTWRMVLQVVRDLHPLFDAINVSTALHRLARFARSQEDRTVVVQHPMYTWLTDCSVRNTSRFQARQLANVSWAVASLGDTSQSCLLQLVVDEFLSRDLSACTDQELANVAWSCGTLGLQHAELQDAVSAEVLRRGLSECQPQAVSNIVWAMATLAHNDKPFLTAALKDMVTRMPAYSTQGIANVLWGAGALGVEPGLVLRPVVPVIIERMAEFSSQELSNMLLGLAKMQVFEPSLIQVLLKESLRPARLPLHALQGIANMCWSLAHMRFRDDAFFESMARQLGRRAHTIGALELSTVLWSLAKLDVHLPRPLLAPLLKQAETLVNAKAIDGQACSLTLWATAVLSGTATPLFRMLFRRQVEFGLTGMDPRAVQQLFQVLLLAQAQGGGGGPAGRTLMKVMPPAMRREVFRMWRQQAKAVSASQFQHEVGQVLERMRIPHANEYLTEGGLFSVDIAIVGASNKVAIEVDGPLHFTSNTLQPMGTSLLRLRLLRALGWKVLSVPFYEWCQLEDGKHGKMDYLARKLTNLEQFGGDPKPPPPHIVAAAMRAHRKQQEGFLVGVPTNLPASAVLSGPPPPSRQVDSDDDEPVVAQQSRAPLQFKGKQRRMPKDVAGVVPRNPLANIKHVGEQDGTARQDEGGTGNKGEKGGKAPQRQGRRKKASDL